jgi:hypothetical protein
MANSAQKMMILTPEWAGIDPVLDGGYPGLGHEVWRQCYKTFFPSSLMLRQNNSVRPW